MTRLALNIAATAELSSSTPAGARTSRIAHRMDAIEENVESIHEQSDESSDDDKESNDIKLQMVQAAKIPPVSIRSNNRPAPLEILDRVKINNILETPRSTIKGVLQFPQHTELKFSRRNLNKVEDQLKRAFVEFYQKLRLLKSYSFLNMLAFSKIMMKYDKVTSLFASLILQITSRNAAKSYMKMVDNSYLGSSDEVSKLMERVEATFIKHFSNSNRSKGMNVLRTKAKRERHGKTFSTGFFAGCTTALLITLIFIIRTRNIVKEAGQKLYMDILFPLYSLFVFVVLHLLMYACNIYFWRRYRVNYSFIFDFKQGTELGYQQVLLVGFGISVLALFTVLCNLDMDIDPKTKDYKGFTEALPLILLVLLFVMLFFPFNILYRSSRFFFLTCLFQRIAAPLYKVTLPDFFLADQFTSQVQALRSLEFYTCYYIWGDFKKRQSNCKTGTYETFNFLVAVIPYTSRPLQCLQRLLEEKDPKQGYNGLKCFLTIVAVCMRKARTLNDGLGWKINSWIFSITAAIFGTYWELVLDWGLLNWHSKNHWLKEKLLVPLKSVYFTAMALNVLLRFAWLQTVLKLNFGSFHKNTTITVVASLEIIRRGIWNFFRLEIEHLNNVGKYRAFKSASLLFNYVKMKTKMNNKGNYKGSF